MNLIIHKLVFEEHLDEVEAVVSEQEHQLVLQLSLVVRLLQDLKYLDDRFVTSCPKIVCKFQKEHI